MNLKGLSELLGLSQTTVSRAVNGYPEVANRTRQRVLEAVLATGYRPSQTARRLAIGGPTPIGIVLPSIEADLRLTSTLLPALATAAARMDCRIEIVPPTNEHDVSSAIHYAAVHSLQCIVWAMPSSSILALLAEGMFPVATIIIDPRPQREIPEQFTAIPAIRREGDGVAETVLSLALSLSRQSGSCAAVVSMVPGQ